MMWRPSRALLVLFLSAVHLAGATDSVYQQNLIINEQKTVENMVFKRKVKIGPYKKLGTVLGRMAEFVKTGTEKQLAESVTWFKVAPSKGIQVEVIFQLGMTFLPADIQQRGFEVSGCTKNVCSGYIHADKLVVVSQHPEVQFIKPFVKPIPRTGSVTSEGDPAMGSDEARSKYDLTGSGVSIGLLSDSFDCDTTASTNYAQDIETGDLPSGITVLEDLTSGCTDEGRAMIQIVHDVAPGANLIFRTAFNGAEDFGRGILELAAAGSDVIVDDIGYAFQPFFQDGVIAQAVDTVFGQGIPYFSAAGNNGRNAWHTEDGFVDSGEVYNDSPLHNFGTAEEVDILQGIYMEAGLTYFLVFQWDEPFASTPGSVGSQSDVDIILVDENGNVVAESVDGNIGGDALEALIYTPPTSGVYGFGITLFDGPAPGYMKWFQFRGAEDLPMEYAVLSSTSFGHPNAAGAAGIGAAEWSNTPRFGVDPAEQESYSSAGGTPIFFDIFGTRLDSPEVREQPMVTGPDGGITTFFGPENRFFGTSAAAPHVAAVAALMLESNSNLSPTEIYAIMKEAAQDMNDTATPEFDVGYDTGTGYGFLDAEVALDIVVTGTVSPTISPEIPTTSSPTGAPATRAPTTRAPVPAPAPTPQRMGVDSLLAPMFGLGDPYTILVYV